MNSLIDMVIRTKQLVTFSADGRVFVDVPFKERRGDILLLAIDDPSQVIAVNIPAIAWLGPVNVPPQAQAEAAGVFTTAR
jgi:hypothetical protein